MLIREIQDDNPDYYRNYLTMDQCVSLLLDIVTPHLIKQDIGMRQKIPPGERLMATLRF